MVRKTRGEKAITLIALIITIVVLLILAVVAINAVTGDGIIQHATNAKTSYDKAQAEENTMISYYQTYLDAGGQIGKWVQNKETIKKVNEDGSVQELKVGDYINYSPKVYDEEGNEIVKSYTSYTSLEDENNKNGRISGYTEDQTFTNDYTETWQVLGTEKGSILLVSTTNISGKMYYLMGKAGYLNGIEELNAICSIYGSGNGAESARSIKVEDINKVTGYKPETKTRLYTQEELSFIKYGLDVTFSYQDNGTIKYSYISSNGEKVTADSGGNGFEYYNGKSWVFLSENNKNITLKNTGYNYYPDTLEYNTINGITEESLKEGYEKLLFGKTNVDEKGSKQNYWLGNTYYRLAQDSCVGIFAVYNYKVSGANMFFMSTQNEYRKCANGNTSCCKIEI